MSNSLDPDQVRRIVGPDLGPNCLPRLSADNIGRQRVKDYGSEINLSLVYISPPFLDWVHPYVPFLAQPYYAWQDLDECLSHP